jgi:hypothetical protein
VRILLSKQFQNTVQGDMSVVAYCWKLKGIVDQLADVDAPITEKKLTMHLTNDLDDQLKIQQEFLELVKPFPCFMEAQSRLQLAEEKIKAKAEASPQILHTTSNGASGSCNCYTCGAPGHLARDCPRGGDHGYNNYCQQQGRAGGQQHGYGNNTYMHQGFHRGGYNGGGARGHGRDDYGGRGGYNSGYDKQGDGLHQG